MDKYTFLGEALVKIDHTSSENGSGRHLFRRALCAGKQIGNHQVISL